MKISPYRHIFNLNANIKNSTGYQSTLRRDVFIKRVSFCSNSIDEKSRDDKSYSEFEKWSKETDFVGHIQEIVDKTGKILGRGFEGTTYEIPDNKKWVIKEYKKGSFIPRQNSDSIISEFEDISPNLNIGQVIARIEIPLGSRYSQIYYILKRQTGSSYGVSYEFSDSISNNLAKIHIKSLELLSKCPESTFEKCIKDIEYITRQGYEIDCCNPSNIMLDSDDKSINFVDINDKLKGNNTQFGNVLYALLDGNFGINFAQSGYSEELQKKSQELSDKIIQKFFKAMNRAGAKFTSGKYFDKLIESNLLDKILNADSVDEKYNSLRAKGLM